MNSILCEIKKIMTDYCKEFLSVNDLEDNGAIFYMNGKNGTEFDWYVNNKISDFMMFYDDEDNMGAVKTTLYDNGSLLTYIYGERGKEVIKEIKSGIDITKEEALSLTAIAKILNLNKEALAESIFIAADLL